MFSKRSNGLQMLSVCAAKKNIITDSKKTFYHSLTLYFLKRNPALQDFATRITAPAISTDNLLRKIT